MGWASGSQIADDVWSIVRPFIPPKHRQTVAKEIIEVFEDEDADDWSDDQLIMEDSLASVDEDTGDL